MHITAKIDYAVRTLLEIAHSAQHGGNAALKADAIASAQQIPPKILETILGELRRADLVVSRRGPDGGYWLARPAAQISVADVIRAIEGPLASVRGQRPEDVEYTGAARSLQHVWIALRVNIRSVLENVSIAEIALDQLPAFVGALTADSGAWARR
ncbi:Rrf2 family transcriptional regulator [Nocardia sp. NPDC005366]|uniref:RrF2 family transcriptional regulator n=1 Tax=Nocardia sp. NPDC005366 TaxID=3156878 RepID=UPI0033B92C6A